MTDKILTVLFGTTALALAAGVVANLVGWIWILVLIDDIATKI